MSEVKKNIRDINAEKTRAVILETAIQQFTVYGYVNTSLDSIAQLVNTTKGAIYHHFQNKKELFRAVYECLVQELMEDIVLSTMQYQGDLSHVLRTLLLKSKEERFRRILFMDGRLVLGGVECRLIDEKYGLNLFNQLIVANMDPVLLNQVGIEVVSKLLFAVVIEAGSFIAHADNPNDTLIATEVVLVEMIKGLKVKQESVD